MLAVVNKERQQTSNFSFALYVNLIFLGAFIFLSCFFFFCNWNVNESIIRQVPHWEWSLGLGLRTLRKYILYGNRPGPVEWGGQWIAKNTNGPRGELKDTVFLFCCIQSSWLSDRQCWRNALFKWHWPLPLCVHGMLQRLCVFIPLLWFRSKAQAGKAAA